MSEHSPLLKARDEVHASSVCLPSPQRRVIESLHLGRSTSKALVHWMRCFLTVTPSLLYLSPSPPLDGRASFVVIGAGTGRASPFFALSPLIGLVAQYVDHWWAANPPATVTF